MSSASDEKPTLDILIPAAQREEKFANGSFAKEMADAIAKRDATYAKGLEALASTLKLLDRTSNEKRDLTHYALKATSEVLSDVYKQLRLDNLFLYMFLSITYSMHGDIASMSTKGDLERIRKDVADNQKRIIETLKERIEKPAKEGEEKEKEKENWYAKLEEETRRMYGS